MVKSITITNIAELDSCIITKENRNKQFISKYKTTNKLKIKLMYDRYITPKEETTNYHTV